MLLLTLSSVASATVLPGKITENTTLTSAGNPYTGSSITVESGVTLNVEPGVKFEIFSLAVKGTLTVEGTAEEPVAFTGKNEEKAGEWTGIVFEPGSGASVIDHAVLKYGCGNIYAFRVNGSSPTIKNSTISQCYERGIWVPDGGSPDIANNDISVNKGPAIEYLANGEESGQVNIHGNDIEGGTNGIHVNITSTGTVSGKTLGGNTITGTGTPLYYSGPDIPSNVTANTLSGNTKQMIEAAGTVASSATWNPGNVPIRVGGTLTVASGATLSINPGVTLIEPWLFVKGTLIADGTAEKPIVMTGDNEKETAEWTGVVFEPGSGASVLDHAVLKYGGGNIFAIKVNSGSSPTITNNTITHQYERGIWVPDGGSPEIANNFISVPKGSAIEYTANKIETGQVDIHDNVIEGGTKGIYVNITESATVGGESLGGNTISGTGTPLYYSGPDIPSNVTANTLSGNTKQMIEAAGTVASSATWNPGNVPLRVPGTITVASGATLSINPGVTLIEPWMTVKGTLIADGTAEKPIVMTGDNEEKAAEWTGIEFASGSGASVVDHTVLKYGGGNIFAIKVNSGSSPTITNNTITHQYERGIWVPDGGSPEIANNFISVPKGSGIEYQASHTETGQVNIHDNLIEGGTKGIYVNITSTGTVSGKTLGGNTITGTGTPLYYSGPDIPSNVTANTLSGNTKQMIEAAGTVASSATWNPGNVPVRVPGTITVASGATLDINPGVVLIEPWMTVKGTLIADGTVEKPIIMTGDNEEKAAEWTGINFLAGSSASVVDHTVLKYGGGNIYAIRVGDGTSPTITNNTITHQYERGIYVPDGGSPHIASNFISVPKGSAIEYTANSSETGQIDIHDNIIEGGTKGIYVNITSPASVAGKALGSNIIVGTGTPLYYSGPDIPSNITANTLSGNTKQMIEAAGTVASSATWNPGNVPIRIGGTLTVASGATLGINPGVTLIEPWMTVKGTLISDGTAEKPIVMTGDNEKETAEWTGIEFVSGSGASIVDHTILKYGGGNIFAIKVSGSSPTITNNTISHQYGRGIYVTSGSPKIEWNRILKTPDEGIAYTGTGKLSAPNNDWGCANGPKPAGCGSAVTSNVEWKPAVQLPELDAHCRGSKSQCGEGADPVSLATGQLSYSNRDLLLTNKSETPLEFTRAYSSGSSADTGLGPGWSQTGLASATEFGSGEVLILGQDGRQDLFYKTETGYKAPSGVTSTLAKVEGTFQLTTLERTVYRFDASGRIASITDDHGLKTTYGYNGEGRLATITDPSAQTLTFSYNASNHISKVVDSTGREVKYTYSGAGDLATVTDVLGGVTEYTYDSEHRLKTIKDPRGNVILKNTHDAQGRIIEQRDGLENLWKLEYAPDETVVTEPEGGEITYEFDSQNRVVSETDQLGHTTTTSYDEAGHVDEVVKPGGAKWHFGHDGDGNLISVIDPEEGERSYEYDGQNRLTSFTDEREETWAYEWSEANDLKKITDPAEGETTFTHNAAGQPLTVTDPNESTTTFTYDSRGNRLTAEDALEHTTAFAYNSRNQLTSTTKPGLEPEVFGRNALGDLLSVTTPDGNKTEYVYDADGMPKQTTDPAENVWKVELNAMERPTAYIDPLGNETKISYDGNLNPVKVIDRRGKETTYAYDLANQLTGVERPEGGDWEFDYDGRGNRIELIEPRENATIYEYDLLDRMTEVEEPLETTTTYDYDPAGNLTSFTDPRENTTELVYDELRQLTAINQPLEKTTSFTYDDAGNWLTRTTAAGTLELEYDAANRLQEVSAGESTLRSFDYDAANRLIGATDAQNDEIEIGYDDDGRIVSIDDGRGQTVSREYDSRGNLIEQTDGRGTLEYSYDKLNRMLSLTDPQSEVLDFDYDPEGNLTEVELPNGILTTNEYDDAGRVAETNSEKAETVLESLEYGYDPYGNRISQVDRLAQETTYDYDPLNRLTEFDPPGEGATEYDYDAAGNRIEAGAITYGFNDLNQLTSASGGTTYDYDDAGRLTEVDDGEASTTYDWNLLDELTNADTGAQEIEYAYDAFGRQAMRDDGSDSWSSHYGDLSDIPILDTDAEGQPTMSYVQGPAGLVEQRSGEATDYPLADAHGDITAIANEAGEAESRQTYDPWGNQLSGPSLEMGYLGAQERRADPATGLIQMGVRPYSPALGSFAAEDPILGYLGVGNTINRYAYVAGNPLRYFDLSGRSIFEDAGGAIADVADPVIDTADYIVSHPGEAATNAVDYWAGSESEAALIFGPLAVLGDMAINPDRAAYYLEKANPAQMAATGIAFAFSVAAAGGTVFATSACLAATPALEAVHVCSFVFGAGTTLSGASMAAAYGIASE